MSLPQTGAPRLARRRLGTIQLVFFAVGASAPFTTLGGGVTTTYAVTGNAGVGLSFILLGVALALFSVGYAAMSRYVANAGAFYSYLANGLGRVAAVGGSFVALVAYNTIQIGLYGLFGFAIKVSFVQTSWGINLPWWGWGLALWAVIGVLGAARIDLNARVLAVTLTLEVIAVIVYDIVAFAHSAGGSISADGLSPDKLFNGGGIGAVFALSVAAFVGFESSAIYSEECRDPKRTVARATYVAVIFIAVLYAVSAWAMATNIGTPNLQKAAGDPVNGGPGLVFGPLTVYTSTTVADIAYALFLTSIFAAMLSFHNGVARYLFALGRERVLPARLAQIGVRTGGPIAGSLLQSLFAVVVILIFAVAKGDPVFDLFAWFSGIAAVGWILLLAGTSAGVVGFFQRRPESPEGPWHRLWAPGIATVLMVALGVLLVDKFGSLLAPKDATGPLRWLLPGIVLAAAVLGLIWGAVIRSSRPEVYEGIGRSATGFTEDLAEEEGLDLSSLR